MWHLLMAHHQESFNPFPSQQGLSCFLSPWQKGAPQSCRVPTFTKATWSQKISIVAASGFKSQHPSSSAAPFPTPPTISYTGQHSRIFPAFHGCHSKSGQAWPHGVEPIISKLSCRCCNEEELPPSYILGGSHSHPPGSKYIHGYLTYL